MELVSEDVTFQEILWRRYPCLNEVIESQLIQGTLWSFIKTAKNQTIEDKLWNFYLHSYTDKSYSQWREEVLNDG